MLLINRLRFTRRLFVYAVICLAVFQLLWILVYHSEPKYLEKSNTRTTRFQMRKPGYNFTMNTTVPNVPILLWWDSVYTSIDEVKTCGQQKCRFTSNRNLQSHPDTKGFLFYGSHLKPYSLPFPRRNDHFWALIHEESPRNAYILSHGDTLNFFNFTSTYNRKSDYPITTQWLQCADWIQDTHYVLPLVDKNRLRQAGLAPILYIHSDCGVSSDRDTYVQLLQRYIDVDSYGACKNNRELPKRLRFNEEMTALHDKQFYQFVARYKFTLAFENYVCEDYITEKLWRPIRVGSVPIVFGAPNVRDFLPSNKSAILIEDFQDVEDLANYIHLLDSNDRLYLEYLDFKNEFRNTNLKHILKVRDWKPEICSKNSNHVKNQNGGNTEDNNQKPYFESVFHGFECFVCNEIVDTLRLVNINNTFKKRVHDNQFKCPSPRRFDQDGHYSVHDELWNREWLTGKYEAEVMESLYDKNKVISETVYRQLVQDATMNDINDNLLYN